MACLLATSTTYWRQRQQREVNTERGPSAERTAMGPRNEEKEQRRWRSGTKPNSACSLRRNLMEDKTRRGDPPNCRARLTCAAPEGKEGGGGPQPNSMRPWCAAGAQGGTPDHSSTEPPCVNGPRTQRGPLSPSRTRKLRANRRGFGIDRAHPPRAGQSQKKGGPHQTSA